MIYDLVFKILSIIFSTAFFLLAVILKNKVGTNYHPAGIFANIWGCFTLIPLIFLYPVPINPLAILYILLCTIAFAFTPLVVGGRLAYLRFKNNIISRENYLIRLDSKFLSLTLLGTSSLGIVFCFWTMFINGWSFDHIFNDLLATAGRFAALRGNEGMEYGLIGSLGVVLTYLSASLGGIIYSVKKTRFLRNMIVLQAMSPGILAMVIQSSKLIFLISFCFFLSGLFLSNIYKLDYFRFNMKNISRVVIILLFISPFILMSFVSREHYGDLNDFYKILDALKYAATSYALGQIYAFSDFFSFYIGMDSNSSYLQDYNRFGAYTFSSIAEIFGAKIDFPPGLYLETGKYEDVFETNIFTIFRGVILDFGISGSLILFMILGAFSNVVFSNIINFRNNIFSSAAYMHIIVFILMTYLQSVFMARYMYANFFILFLILIANGVLMKNKSQHKN